MVTPIFLFSLPRSGSTLVQRVLGSRPEIATVSEPWILLPFLYTLREQGAYANYVHHGAVRAIRDFYNEFPDGRNDYLAELRQFVLNLYMKTAVYKDQYYFLDKTPRYHLIAQEIIELFPNAKFIFLWRNPLAIAASMIQTWGKGKWILYRFNVDLYEGFCNLVNVYEKNKEHVCSIQFENLISDTQVSWKSICSYLEIPFDSNMLHDFTNLSLRGRYGDHTGKNSYSLIDNEPVEKWKLAFNNIVRQKWGHQYLEKLGQHRLKTIGYELDKIQTNLNNIELSYKSVASDLIRLSYGRFYTIFEPQTINHRLEKNRKPN